jgi:hypothetical protein
LKPARAGKSANQNARLIAPDHARGLLAAAKVTLVDDIVVKEGGGVHELDGGGELDVRVAAVTAHLRRRKGQHRAQPLAAGADQVTGDLGIMSTMGAGMQQDGLVDPRHVLGNQLNDQIDAGLAVFAAIERYNELPRASLDISH